MCNILRLLIVHNRYLQPGGEDAVVDNEAALLKNHSHLVESVIFYNDKFIEIPSAPQAVAWAIATVYSRSSLETVIEKATHNSSDVLHIHNTFPSASPSVAQARNSQETAVVQTLHNYRLLCPNALFFRDGHVCEECLGKFVPWPGVAHACYRNSRSQTGVTAAMLTFHRARRTWHRDVDRFIALTEFSRQKFIEGGLPADKIVVKPNFVDMPVAPVSRDRTGFLFVGRLADYKGNMLLPAAWRLLQTAPALRVIGSGPETSAMDTASAGIPEIDLLGQCDRPVVLDEMASTVALVFPSILYENFPMTIVEAFACGTPVIASNLGAMAEIIDDHRTGLLFEPGNADDLANKVRWANEHPDKMREYGMNARKEYEQKYTAERNYQMLMDIYQQAIEHRQAHPPARWPR